MRDDELTQLLVGTIVTMGGVVVGGWKVMDARSASRIRAEQRRADEALTREQSANERAARYEAQRDKAMENAREAAALLSALATRVEESEKRCREGLAALGAKIDALTAALTASRQGVGP